MIASGRQIREGRQLLGLSQADLAADADVALALVVRAEASDGMPLLKRCDAKALQLVLETAGVEFISEFGSGGGVRLRKVSIGTGPSK